MVNLKGCSVEFKTLTITFAELVSGIGPESAATTVKVYVAMAMSAGMMGRSSEIWPLDVLMEKRDHISPCSGVCVSVSVCVCVCVCVCWCDVCWCDGSVCNGCVMMMCVFV